MQATAFAFAGAFARETETCGTDFCTLRVAALARVVRTVLIRATSAIYFETCAGVPPPLFPMNRSALVRGLAILALPRGWLILARGV